MNPPSIGSIVYYYNNKGEGPFASIITHVNSADFISLVYWDGNGKQHFVKEATNPGFVHKLYSCWCWPK